MTRRQQRTRRNSVTRTYPIYTISPSELSAGDDESIIEIKPIKRHRKHRSRVRPQESIRSQYVSTGKIRVEYTYCYIKVLIVV